MNGNQRRYLSSGLVFFAAMIVMMTITAMFSRNRAISNDVADCSYGQFVTMVEEGDMESVSIGQNAEVPTGTVTFTAAGKTWRMNVSDVNDVQDLLDEHGVDYRIAAVTSNSGNSRTIFLVVIVGIVIIGMVIMMSVMMRSQGGVGANPMMNFGKSKAKMVHDVTEYDFSKVAGLEEEK